MVPPRAAWASAYSAFKEQKARYGPGLDEVSILDLGEAKGTRDQRLSAV